MCDSEAEKILFILNKHEREYRLLIPVYIFFSYSIMDFTYSPDCILVFLYS